MHLSNIVLGFKQVRINGHQGKKRFKGIFMKIYHAHGWMYLQNLVFQEDIVYVI